MSQSNKFLLAFVLVLVITAPVAFAQQNVYLYNQNVAGDVNIGVFLQSGEVEMLGAKEGMTVRQVSKEYVYGAPAPAPYPQVHVWEKDIERLGRTDSLEPILVAQMNGISFPNIGTGWVKGREELVLWELEIPNASSRQPSEFEKNLTLTLWVDWNGDKVWDKTETVIREHINLQSYFPTGEAFVKVYYLTSFTVPDVDAVVTNAKGAGPAHGTRAMDVYLWTRGIVSYDDPDVSPDGAQIFGEVEDYRVVYVSTSNMRND